MFIFYYVILFLNIAIVLGFLKRDLSRYSPSAILWLALLATFLFPAVADPFAGFIQPHVYSVGYELDILTLVEAHGFVFIFLVSFLCIQISMLNVGRVKQSVKWHFLEQMGTNKSTGMCGLLVFLALSFYVPIELYLLFGRAAFTSLDFTTRRENQSFLAGFLSSYNFVICAGALFWLWHTKRILTGVLVVLVYLFFYLVFGGSRQPLILLGLPFLCYFLFSSRVGLVYCVLIVVSFGFISKFLEYLLYVRNLSGIDARLEALPGVFNYLVFSQERLGSSEQSLRFAFYYFVQSGMSESGFGVFSYLTRVLFFWMPSFLDPANIKPGDFEYTMFASYMPGYVGTMHPTFFGSLYADGGWFIIPWLIFFVAVYNSTSFFLKKYNGICFFAIWGAYAYLYMMMARGSLYGPFVVLAFGLIFVSIAQRFSLKLKLGAKT